MQDMLELLLSIPYEERVAGGQLSQDIRKALQDKAVKKQANSEAFQAQSAQQNAAFSLPKEFQGQMPMPQPEQEMGAEVPADIGVLFE